MVGANFPGKHEVRVRSEILDSIVEPPVVIAEDGLANFRWHVDGLKINTVDPANSIAVNQDIPKRAFVEFDVRPSDGVYSFGTRCKTIANLLKASSPGETVSLIIDSNLNQMKIQFGDVNYSLAGVGTRSITEPNLPEFDYEVECRVNPHVFDRAHQVVGMLSDTISIELENGEFRVKGEGDDDSAEINVEIVEDDESLLDGGGAKAMMSDASRHVSSRYPSRLIDWVNQFTPTDTYKIAFAEDFPLRIDALRMSGELPIVMIVAPKLESG